MANLMQECVVEGKVADTARNRATKADVREFPRTWPKRRPCKQNTRE